MSEEKPEEGIFKINGKRYERLMKSMEDMAKETHGLGPPEPENLLDAPPVAIQQVLVYPDSLLRRKCEPITEDDDVLEIVSKLTTTMYAVGGVGLAAPQIGISKRVFAVDIFNGEPPSADLPPHQLLVAVNPQIWAFGTAMETVPEQCLSLPGANELIQRWSRIVIKAQDVRGRWYAMKVGKTLARAIQHEYDHLDGRLLIDLVAAHRRKKIRRDLKTYLGRRNGNTRVVSR